MKLAKGHIILILFIFSLTTVKSQDSEVVKQLSGVIIGNDTTKGMLGVHVYIPKNGRGTTTNFYGYFSLPVLPGDSLVISSVGYEKQHLIIPYSDEDHMTVVVELSPDSAFLPEIEILPYPTEELFKEAILALEIPNEYEWEILKQSLRNEDLTNLFQAMALEGSLNYKFQNKQQFDQAHNKVTLQYANNPLLNPFAWSKFIQSLRNKNGKE